MQRRIAVLVAATTSAVILAFLIPLALLVRNMAADRAMADADQEARNIALLVSSLHGDSGLASVVAAADQRSPARSQVVLANNRVLGDAGVPADSEAVLKGRQGEAFTGLLGSDRLIVVPVVTADGTDVVLTRVDAAELRNGVTGAWLALAGLGLGLLTLSLLIARQLGRRISTPVIRVADVADRLREGDLEARAVPSGPHETQALAEALNRLAERINELLLAERAAVGDLSHRLRTPVTALRIDVEGLQDPALAEQLGQHVGNLQRSIDAIVNDARRPVRHSLDSVCDAAAVTAQRIEYWSPLAEDQGRDLEVRIAPGPARVGLDAEDLRDVIDILVDNVFAHTPEGTAFSVKLVREADRLVLEVADQGPGIEPEPHQGPRTGHSGLGLQIVRRTVARDGEVTLAGAAAGGTVVRVRLPRPAHH